MKSFLQYVKETLDSPLIIKWKKYRSGLKGLFNIGYDKFVIKCFKLNNNNNTTTYTFKFYLNDGGDIIYSLTGNNTNKFRIITTITDGFKYLMKSENPDVICFASNTAEESRTPFYENLCKRAEKKYNLKLKINNTGKICIYFLYKKEEDLKAVNMDELNKKLQAKFLF